MKKQTTNENENKQLESTVEVELSKENGDAKIVSFKMEEDNLLDNFSFDK